MEKIQVSVKLDKKNGHFYMRRTYIYDNINVQFFFECGRSLPSSTPSDAYGVDSLPSVAQFGELESLLCGHCTWTVLTESRSTVPAVTHTPHTLGFLGLLSDRCLL